MLQLLQSGGTDIMSANILCKPLLKTLPCLVMIRDDVMFVLLPLFKPRFLGLAKCFDTRGWMRREDISKDLLTNQKLIQSSLRSQRFE